MSYNVKNKIYELKSLNLKSLHTRKKAEKYHIVGIGISTNDSTEDFEIWILPQFPMLCNLQTQLTQITNQQKLLK